jgi:hypothetical protein
LVDTTEARLALASVQLYSAVVYTVPEWTETGLNYKCTSLQLIRAQCVHSVCNASVCTAVQLIQAKCLIHKPQHKYGWVKQSVCTRDNKKQSVHRPYWSWKRAVAFAVSAKEFGFFSLFMSYVYMFQYFNISGKSFCNLRLSECWILCRHEICGWNFLWKKCRIYNKTIPKA